jgi:hypothetical protein
MIDLATISFEKEWVVAEQIRLLRKYLTDDYTLSVYDNSGPSSEVAWRISNLCFAQNTRYVLSPTRERTHEQALLHASEDLLNRQAPYIGFLDHDCFPTRPTSLVALAEKGVFGVQQNQKGITYLWPGLLVIRRSWLDEKTPLNLGSVGGADTGSGLSELLTVEDLAGIPEIEYGYEEVLPGDGPTQWRTVERIGDLVHLSNASNWLKLPNFPVREATVQRLVSAL